jgi:hypothetical protein
LAVGWFKKNTSLPITTAYKVCKIHFKWWGFQTIMEKYIQKLCATIQRDTLAQQYCFLDEFYGWTMEDLESFENEKYVKANRVWLIIYI